VEQAQGIVGYLSPIKGNIYAAFKTCRESDEEEEETRQAAEIFVKLRLPPRLRRLPGLGGVVVVWDADSPLFIR